LRFAVHGLGWDERGVAALEGLLVFGLLAGVFLACLLAAQWGTSLQSAQMGARLLAFDAGDVELARLGRPSSQPVQQYASQTWDTLASAQTAQWLSGMFTLANGDLSGNVTGTAQGRLASGASLFEYVPAAVGFHAHGWSAASDPWDMSESLVSLTFLRLAYTVGLTRMSPGQLDSTCARQIPEGSAILETIYARVGR
jgi:hypothetical protein